MFGLTPPSWYTKAEAFLEPSWPLLVVLSLAVIAITVGLLLAGEAAPLAAWLVYLYMP